MKDDEVPDREEVAGKLLPAIRRAWNALPRSDFRALQADIELEILRGTLSASGVVARYEEAARKAVETFEKGNKE